MALAMWVQIETLSSAQSPPSPRPLKCPPIEQECTYGFTVEQEQQQRWLKYAVWMRLNGVLVRDMVCQCQFYIMLRTIFSDNKIGDLPVIESVYNYKDVTILGPNHLRMSLSPKKCKQTKKFFYSIRNKSIRKIQEQESAQKQLETLIRKEKIILMAQKTSLNDLLLPTLDIPLKEAELMGFPSIDIKRISESDVRSNSVRKNTQKRGAIDMIDFKAEYDSNIFRSKKPNLQTITNTHNIKETQAPKPNPQEKQVKHQKIAISIPQIKTNRPPSDISQQSPQMPKSNTQSYSPTKLTQIKSFTKFQEKVSTQRKYKKGFLSYETDGQQRWQKIKTGIQKGVKMKVENASRLVSAKIFYVYDVEADEPVVGHNQREDIEIASLSKVMTCYLSILIARKYEIDLKTSYYRVPDRIPETPGTSAELLAGDLLTAEDLLYALMLPSGNDASICLAELMGKIIQRHKKKEQRRTYFQTFIGHMNAFSKQLQLEQQWNNSSGLPCNPNFSTAQAIVGLSALAMKNELFKRIVTTQQIQIEVKNDRYGLTTKKLWRNTNKLLQKGWQGVKTGTTQTAGHCLISKKSSLLMGVFDCQTMAKRFTDSIKLYDHICKVKQS